MGSVSSGVVIPLGLKVPKTIAFCNKLNPKINMTLSTFAAAIFTSVPLRNTAANFEAFYRGKEELSPSRARLSAPSITARGACFKLLLVYTFHQ